jgi:hypothetical protein
MGTESSSPGIVATGPDGTEHEFPAGTSPDVVDKAMKSYALSLKGGPPVAPPPTPTGLLDAPPQKQDMPGVQGVPLRQLGKEIAPALPYIGGAAAALAPEVSIPGAMAYAGLGGALGSFGKQGINAAVGEPTPNTAGGVLKQAGIEGGGQALGEGGGRLVSKGIEKIAPELAGAAREQFARGLSLKGAANVEAQPLAGQLMDRGLHGTLNSLRGKTADGLQGARDALNAALTKAGSRKIDLKPVVGELEQAKGDLIAWNNPAAKQAWATSGQPAEVALARRQGVLPPGREAVLNELSNYQNELQRMGPSEYSQVREWRKPVAEMAYPEKPWEQAATPTTKREAAKLVDTALRKHLSTAVPEVANANREFSFWKDADEVVENAQTKAAGQGPTIPSILLGPKFAAVNILGYLKKAIGSPGWNTNSAALKNGLAHMLSQGDAEGLAGFVGRLGGGEAADQMKAPAPDALSNLPSRMPQPPPSPPPVAPTMPPQAPPSFLGNSPEDFKNGYDPKSEGADAPSGNRRFSPGDSTTPQTRGGLRSPNPQPPPGPGGGPNAQPPAPPPNGAAPQAGVGQAPQILPGGPPGPVPLPVPPGAIPPGLPPGVPPQGAQPPPVPMMPPPAGPPGSMLKKRPPAADLAQGSEGGPALPGWLSQLANAFGGAAQGAPAAYGKAAVNALPAAGATAFSELGPGGMAAGGMGGSFLQQAIRAALGQPTPSTAAGVLGQGGKEGLIQGALGSIPMVGGGLKGMRLSTAEPMLDEFAGFTPLREKVALPGFMKPHADQEALFKGLGLHPEQNPPKRFAVTAVTPEEYAKADRNPQYVPMEKLIDYVESPHYALAEKKFEKLQKEGKYPKGSNLLETDAHDYKKTMDIEATPVEPKQLPPGSYLKSGKPKPPAADVKFAPQAQIQKMYEALPNAPKHVEVGAYTDPKTGVIHIPEGTPKDKIPGLIAHERAHKEYRGNPDLQQQGQQLLEAVVRGYPGPLPQTIQHMQKYMGLKEYDQPALAEEAYAAQRGFMGGPPPMQGPPQGMPQGGPPQSHIVGAGGAHGYGATPMGTIGGQPPPQMAAGVAGPPMADLYLGNPRMSEGHPPARPPAADMKDPVDALGMSGGDPAAMQLAVGTARGDQTGAPVDPKLAALSPAELAPLDRFSQGAIAGQQGGLVGAPGAAMVGAGNEAAKYLGLTNLIAKITGDPQFKQDQTMSAPSTGNVGSLIHGYLTGAFQNPTLRSLILGR